MRNRDVTGTDCNVRPSHLGLIVCRHCLNVIDTLDTNRVRIFYGECDDCRKGGRGENEKNANEVDEQ